MISKQYNIMTRRGDLPWQSMYGQPFSEFRHAEQVVESFRSQSHEQNDGHEYKIVERVVGDWSDTLEGTP